MAAALLFSTISRRLQPPCAALLILAAVQLLSAQAAHRSTTFVRGVLAPVSSVAAQIEPERS